MREETKRKLEAHLRWEWRRKVLFIALAVMAPLSAIFLYQPPSDRIIHDNAELTWSTRRLNDDTGQVYAQMMARLRDGRVVKVRSRTRTLPPPVGTEIQVVEEMFWIGYTQFVWEGAN